MAIRTIRVLGEDILRKTSKPVTEMTPRIRQLIDDMLDTMYEADGVGLAAPQVGILRRIFVADCGDGPMVFINPEILDTEGEQTGEEGCLSVPGKHATVTRAMKVTARALDRDMKPFTVTGEGLLARCILHENDHLDGIVYVDKAESPVVDNEPEE